MEENKTPHEISKFGFGAHPENINRKGANKGSKWKKTLLKELMTIDLFDAKNEIFEKLFEEFPIIFNNSDKEKNLQLLMELKQISLVFNEDPRISQAAITAIKDRIEGKPQQHIDHTSEGAPIVWHEEKTYDKE